jgi:DNA-binding SARP family transcriptional activator
VQRHRLALLALLATAPRHLLSRERLMALLWPEANTASARNLLNSAVHSIRRALGEGVLVSEVNGIALDLKHLRVDVPEFEAASSSGDAEAAVERYTGAFLDGLALPGAVEFERWQEQERERLEHIYMAALEQVGDERARTQDAAAAVPWWWRRLGCSPLDARVVMRLMTLLAQSGDRAEALRVAATHAALLKAELDAAPDAEVQALAERLRSNHPGTDGGFWTRG